MYATPADLSNDSFLGWFDPDDSIWKLAVLGNHGEAGSLAGSYTDLTYEDFLTNNLGWNAVTMLGAYGVDAASGEVWAVINHNSDFGAIAEPVPEPATWVLAILGLGATLVLRRRLSP